MSRPGPRPPAPGPKMLDDQTWFAEIPGFEGVWANAATVEACRSEFV